MTTRDPNRRRGRDKVTARFTKPTGSAKVDDLRQRQTAAKNLTLLRDECTRVGVQMEIPIAKRICDIAEHLFSAGNDLLEVSTDNLVELTTASENFERFLIAIEKRVQTAHRTFTNEGRVTWVIGALDKATVKCRAGDDIRYVCERIAEEANRVHTKRPVATSTEAWMRAVKDWKGPKVQKRGNPGVRKSYKPYEIVFRLLCPSMPEEQVPRKAKKLLDNYRHIFEMPNAE